MAILVVDIGGNAGYSVARYVRSERVFCHLATMDRAERAIEEVRPVGLVLTGDAMPEAGPLPPWLVRPELPLLALGDASRALLLSLGGQVGRLAAQDAVRDVAFADVPLFEGASSGKRAIDRAYALTLPESAEPLGGMAGTVLSFRHREHAWFGFQCNPELHDYEMTQILRNFCVTICGEPPDWTASRVVQSVSQTLGKLSETRELFVIVTGGVDSSVLAMLAHQAIGERLHCLFVDTGFLRKNEAADVVRLFRARMGIDVRHIDAGERFLRCIEGVADPVQKFARIHRQFDETLAEALRPYPGIGQLASTIYVDTLQDAPESSADDITTSPDFPTWEPLRHLFKDEIRSLGEYLKVPHSLVQGQPFPDAGLALRCRGAVTRERLHVLREADALFRQRIEQAGLGRHLMQYFAVLLGQPSLSASGLRTGHTVVLRAVQRQGGSSAAAPLPAELLREIASSLTALPLGITRVLYDISDQPPAAIEWD